VRSCLDEEEKIGKRERERERKTPSKNLGFKKDKTLKPFPFFSWENRRRNQR
jgi:hypothetical protein